MIEVIGRAGPARLVKWQTGEHKVIVPSLIACADQAQDGFGWDLKLVPGESVDRVIAQLTEDMLFEIPADLYPPFHHSKGNSGIIPTIGKGCTVLRGDPSRFKEQWAVSPAPVAIMGNAFEMRRDARQFAHAIVALREAVGHRTLIYAPGMMDVSNLALMVYMGVDLCDDVLLGYLAHNGRACTADGALDVKKARWLLEEPTAESTLRLSREYARRELELVRYHIREESLRELVEMRVISSPWMVAALRVFDEEHYDFQERYYPVVGPELPGQLQGIPFQA